MENNMPAQGGSRSAGQKIIPHLWFDKEAKLAAEFYAAVFPNSKVTSTSVLHNTPSGDCDVVSFTIMDYKFMAISAGPLFKFNPSISFMLNFDPSKDKNAKAQLDQIWQKLSEGGKILMPLDKYPFSEHYGWVEDKFGVSWQLILTNPAGDERPFIVPAMLFTGNVYGKAEEATDFYISVFSGKGGNSRRGTIARYPAGMGPDKEGTVMFTDVMLQGQWLAAMDSGHEHNFSFNEAISFLISCNTQEEIDYYWEKLTADGGEESQCGWLKDKFGVSWQVSPSNLEQIMKNGTPEQIDRVTQAFLSMKKFDLAKLNQAYKEK